jgi:GLPGLI family protein
MMINKKILVLVIALSGFLLSTAQIFINKGSIVFERKVQIHKILEGNSWFKGNMDNIPKFYVSQFQLRFNPDTMVYSKTSDDEPNSASWAVYARDNEIVTLLNAKQNISKKNIWNDTYIIKDSMPQYKWKLVNETRKIAGIECKKATTIVNDSIYIVAFYAENILVSGGPEQFNGLPGMILGIVIPRLHATYYAQKVESNENLTIVLPKRKNKTIMNRKEFREMVIKNLKWAFDNSALGALYLFI